MDKLEAVARALAKHNYPSFTEADIDEMGEGYMGDARAALDVLSALADHETQSMIIKQPCVEQTIDKAGWLTTGPAQFPIGTPVHKASGPQWQGVVVGYYSSSFTPEGLVIECTAEGARGQCHVEPAKRMVRDGVTVLNTGSSLDITKDNAPTSFTAVSYGVQEPSLTTHHSVRVVEDEAQ